MFQESTSSWGKERSNKKAERRCPLPMEPGSHGGFLDWIWLGLSHSVETNRSRRALNFNPMHACVTRLLAVCSLCLHSVSPAVNKQKCCCMLQPRTALFRSISPHCHRIPESGNGEMFGILVEESWEGLSREQPTGCYPPECMKAILQAGLVWACLA